MRLTVTPDHKRWICADCGIDILWTRIDVEQLPTCRCVEKGHDLACVCAPKMVAAELVDALDLVAKRDEDLEAAEADGSLRAGLLEERMTKVETLLRTAIDKENS
jgi:hypothetical protein